MKRSNGSIKLVLFLGIVGWILLVTAAPVAAQEGWRMTRRADAAGTDLNAIFFLDSKRGWIGGNAGLVLSTTDAGRTWVGQNIGVSTAINDIYFRDKENGFLLTGNRIYQSRDAGASWRESQVFDEVKFGGVPELYSIRFIGKNNGWVVGSISKNDAYIDNLVLHTEDGGTSWRRVLVPGRDELIHLDFASERRGWIVGDSGTVLYTADAGDSWTVQRTGSTAALYHVDFRTEDRGWIVGEKGIVLRTVDGGETWMQAPTPVKNRLLSVQFVDDRRGWVIGRGGVILRSEDGGVTWIQQTSPSTQNLYGLFVDSKNAWAVGGDGNILQFER
jgi:photosystem II stability/assembly factor-like uncharacterized protein